MVFRVLRLDHAATLPWFAYSGDAGLDLNSSGDIAIELKASALVRTGIVIALPTGAEGQRRPLSGLALKRSEIAGRMFGRGPA